MATNEEQNQKLKDAELKKIEAETEKIQAEKQKILFESTEIKRRNLLPKLLLQSIIAGLVAVPLIWFFVKEITIPLMQSENIKLKLDNEKTNYHLQLVRTRLDSAKKEFQEQLDLLILQKERIIAEDIKRLNRAKNDIEKITTLYKGLQTENLEVKNVIDNKENQIRDLNQRIAQADSIYKELLSPPVQRASFQNIISDQKVMKDFRKNNITREVLKKVVETIISVQHNLSEIASKYSNLEQIEMLEKKTLNYFESPQAPIAEWGDKTIARNITISNYLDQLKNLDYERVSVFYGTNLTLSRLLKVDKNSFEIDVGCWAYFVARNAEGKIDKKQKTYKKFYLQLKRPLRDWEVRIISIKEEPTRGFNLNDESW